MNPFKFFRYTAAEQREILSSLVMLVDSREKVNDHITKWFESKGIKYATQTLDYGDYTFLIPANPKLGIGKDMYFDIDFVIERKAHLEELSTNLGEERERFDREFQRARNCRMMLLIERGGWEEILDGQFKTDFNPKSYFASLLTFKTRYGLDVTFVDKQHSGQFIYSTFYYFVRELLLS